MYLPALKRHPSSSCIPAEPYLGLHLPTDRTWREFCSREAGTSDNSWVTSIEQCHRPAATVARYLAQLGLPSHYSWLYVAADADFSEGDAATLLAAGFHGVVSQRLACSVPHAGRAACAALPTNLTDKALRSAVDLFMLAGSHLFVGNAFSALSATVRLMKYARRDPLASLADALYYNAPLDTTAADVSPTETHLFGVYPGVLHRHLYEAHTPASASLLAMHRGGLCQYSWSTRRQGCFNHTQPPPHVVEVNVEHAEVVDSGGGAISLNGSVSLDSVWFPRLEILLDGKPVGTLVANERLSARTNGFSGQILLPPALESDDVGTITVCSTDAADRTCSDPFVLDMQWEDQWQQASKAAGSPILYMHFPETRAVTGGPEALHQLHQEVNRWHAAGEVSVRSVFPVGNPIYRGRQVRATVLSPKPLTIGNRLC